MQAYSPSCGSCDGDGAMQSKSFKHVDGGVKVLAWENAISASRKMGSMK